MLRSRRPGSSACNDSAFVASFDRGLARIFGMLEHMSSTEYDEGSSQDLYDVFVAQQDVSEGICDALLAVRETTRSADVDNATSYRRLTNHVSDKIRGFVWTKVPGLLHRPQGINKGTWSTQFALSSSRGLKKDVESITAGFIDDLIDSFDGGAMSWSYRPDLLCRAFETFAVGFEKALGEEYSRTPRTKARDDSVTDHLLSGAFRGLSLTSPSRASAATLPNGITQSRRRADSACFGCQQPGHWIKDCPRSGGDSVALRSPPRSAICYRCRKPGHLANQCSLVRTSQSCYKCGRAGRCAVTCVA